MTDLQPQKPIPIAEMPDEFKDGRPVLLWGGTLGYDWVEFDPDSQACLKPMCCAYIKATSRWQPFYTNGFQAIDNPTHFLPVWQEELS
jgi:hypothetical protein